MHRALALLAALALVATAAGADAKGKSDKTPKTPKAPKTHCVDATTGKKAVCGTANAKPAPAKMKAKSK